MVCWHKEQSCYCYADHVINKFVHMHRIWLLLHLRPNYIHSASNDIHTDGPRARKFADSAYFVTLK